MASSGLRMGELIQLRLSDVNLDEDPALVRARGIKAKGKKPRVTFMSGEAERALQLYLEQRRRRIEE